MSRKSNWYGYDSVAQRLTLVLHVQPNAGKTGIAGLHGDALKVRVAAPAADNRANACLVSFLSATLGVPVSAIRIRQGATGRRKRVELTAGPAMVERLVRMVG